MNTKHTPASNVCQNCGKHWKDEELEEITHGFWERVAPGEICPSGECPECGALCTPDTRETRLIAAAPELLEALRSLRQEIKSALKFDVKKHYHLMVADVCADKAIRKAEGEA